MGRKNPNSAFFILSLAFFRELFHFRQSEISFHGSVVRKHIYGSVKSVSGAIALIILMLFTPKPVLGSLNNDSNSDSKSLYTFISKSSDEAISTPLPAPQDGDYQTLATGNWNSNTSWQVRAGGAWNNCAPGDYPGVAAGAGTVTIRNGHVITLTANVPNAIGALTFEDATTLATTVVMTTRTLNVTGGITFGAPAADPGDQSITITTGTLTCASVYMPTTAFANYDDFISLTSGTLTSTGNILMDGASDRNYITYTGAGILTVGGNFTGGGFTCATSTVTYNGINQQVGGYVYNNLIFNGGGTKTLTGAASVGGTLTLTSGIVRLGNFDLTLTNTTAIGGAPFSTTKMVETNGTGKLTRSANVTNQSFNTLIWPVGSNGYYNEFIMTNLPAGAAAARSLSIRAVPTNPGVLTIFMNKYWEITTTGAGITTQALTVLSFAYNNSEIIGDQLQVQLYTNTSGSWVKATGASAAGSNPSTSTYAGASTITGSWTAGAPGTYYSYQSGNWDQASTWTFDPGGTTGPGLMVPGLGDKVVILTGRTVTLPSDIVTQNLDITINTGGSVDLSTFKFTNGLTALRGSGTLRLSSANFPTPITTNTFVSTDGGTTEYDAGVTMPATQATYYHLTVKTAGIVILKNNITLNGNLYVKQGTFQINDATAQRLALIIKGNVTVDNTGSITVGTGLWRFYQ